MKMRSTLKRLLAATLAAMLTGLAACGGDNSSSSQASSEESTQGTAAGLPLTEEPVTLRFWFSIPAANGITDYNQSDYYQWLEEQTGVHIDWTIPIEGTDDESFNLLFASDNMPDLVLNSNSRQYKSGPDVAISDGAYLRLNELCDELAPNYMGLINADPALQKDTVTDEGNRWAFNSVINTLILVCANQLSRKYTETSLF